LGAAFSLFQRRFSFQKSQAGGMSFPALASSIQNRLRHDLIICKIIAGNPEQHLQFEEKRTAHRTAQLSPT